MAIGDIIDETVGDLEVAGRDITYPLSPDELAGITHKYDFHIKKKDHRWMYVDSWGTLKKWGGHKKATEDGGGRWRIVDSAKAEIVEEGGDQDV